MNLSTIGDTRAIEAAREAVFAVRVREEAVPAGARYLDMRRERQCVPGDVRVAIRVTAQAMRIPIVTLTEQTRDTAHGDYPARCIAMVIARHAVTPEPSWPEIAGAFGLADHWSVLRDYDRGAVLLLVSDAAAEEAIRVAALVIEAIASRRR